MEILSHFSFGACKPRAVLLDFDGTLSTLRYGWEQIMAPMMLEMIAGPTPIDEKLAAEVGTYINNSTGIQTIYQMQWLAETVRKYARNPGMPDDPWWYKAEYNRRLMEPVEKRKNRVLSGEKSPDEYLIKGSRAFLKALQERGVDLYVASGTDHHDVLREARVLQVEEYFKEIAGAPPGRADCSKEMVLRKLVQDNRLMGAEVVVIGDGKVEIALGRDVGAITLGVASEEEKGCGVNPVKRERLVRAGAHAIVGDYEDLNGILKWMGL